MPISHPSGPAQADMQVAMRIVGRSAPVVGAILLATTIAAPVHASEHPPLAEWPVMLRTGPIDLRDQDGPRGDPGRWTARNVTLQDGHLRLTLEVTPAPVHLPVRLGPAVLFIGIGASGGSGDVGYQQRLRVDTETAPACTGDPCRYRFEVDADLTGLPAMVAAADIDPFVMADVGFTFARTFGDGSWLQVMDSFRAARRDRPFHDGRSVAGTLLTTGLVPVGRAEGWTRQQPPSTLAVAERVKRLTAGLSDRSRALDTVRVRLAFDAPACWPYHRLAIHDDQATRPFDAAILELDPAGTVVSVPDDTTWNVTLYESGMVDGDLDGNVRIPAGTFTTSGQDLELHATFTCGDTPIATLTATPAAGLLPVPTALRLGGWTEGYDREKHRRRELPFTVAAQGGRYVALDWDPDTGWTELTSRDGRRWSSRSISTADGLPEPTQGLDARLWSVGDGLVLTAVVPSATGIPELQTWARAGTADWVAGTPVPVVADLAVKMVAEHAGVHLLALGAVGSGPITSLLRSAGGGSWEPVTGPDRNLVALTGTADGFAGVVADAGGALVTSADGLAWATAGSLPEGPMESPALAVVDGRLFLAATDALAVETRGWRQAEDGTWEPVLRTLGTLLGHGVAASGSTVAVLTRVGDEYGFGAGAVSTDGGQTWDRGEAVDTVADVCPLSVAVAGTTAVAGIGMCDPSAVATRWHAAPRAGR